MKARIKDDYCSYELMPLLKDTDFEECVPAFSFIYCYRDEEDVLGYRTYTHSHVMKWLREAHNVCVNVEGSAPWSAEEEQKFAYTCEVADTQSNKKGGKEGLKLSC